MGGYFVCVLFCVCVVDVEVGGAVASDGSVLIDSGVQFIEIQLQVRSITQTDFWQHSNTGSGSGAVILILVYIVIEWKTYSCPINYMLIN